MMSNRSFTDVVGRAAMVSRGDMGMDAQRDGQASVGPWEAIVLESGRDAAAVDSPIGGKAGSALGAGAEAAAELVSLSDLAGTVGSVPVAEVAPEAVSVEGEDESVGGGESVSVVRVAWTPERVRALGMTTTVETAAEIIGIGRTMAYELLREDAFPVPVLRLAAKAGRRRTGRVLVPVAGLLTLLVPDARPVPGGSEQSG